MRDYTEAQQKIPKQTFVQNIFIKPLDFPNLFLIQGVQEWMWDCPFLWKPHGLLGWYMSTHINSRVKTGYIKNCRYASSDHMNPTAVDVEKWQVVSDEYENYMHLLAVVHFGWKLGLPYVNLEMCQFLKLAWGINVCVRILCTSDDSLP